MTGDPRAASATADSDCVLLALDRENFNIQLGPLKDVLDENMNARIIGSIKIFATLGPAEKKMVIKAFTFESFNAGKYARS